MARVNKKRLTADIQGDFVVFLIGMRINKLWKVHKWLPVVMAMPRMLRELSQKPDMGLLGYRNVLAGPRSPMVIQYWRSWEQLERYARNRDAKHFPAWVKFNKAVGSNGDVGLWHETYRVAAGQYETFYNSVAPLGLGKAAGLVPAAGYRSSAAGRLGLADGTDAPVDPSGEVRGPAESR